MWNPLLWLLLGCAIGVLAYHRPSAYGLGLHLLASSAGALLGGVTFLIFDTTPLHLVAGGALVAAAAGSLIAVLLMRRVVRQLSEE